MIVEKYFIDREKCPACHSDEFQNLYKCKYDSPEISRYLKCFYTPQGDFDSKYLKNSSYIICECNDCKLIFQKLIPNDEFMEVIYEKWLNPQKAFLRHKKIDDLNYYTYYSSEISSIIAYLDKPPSDLSFFDFGMGWGNWALLAKGFGCESSGSELSEERIQYAKNNGLNVIDWDQISKLKFDFINTEQVFEHLSNPFETLEYLKNSLKDNGLIKISVPTALNISKRIDRMDWNAQKNSKYSLNPIAPLEHINYFRRESLLKMASLLNMKEIVIPMRLQYSYSTNWKGFRRIGKNIILPVYRNILKRQNYLFFQNK